MIREYTTPAAPAVMNSGAVCPEMKANYDQSFNLDFPRSSLKESALETCNQAILTLPAVCSENSIEKGFPLKASDHRPWGKKKSLKVPSALNC